MLRFFYGTMGSGKSTVALQIRHNLSRGGLDGLLFSQLDRSGTAVSSRLGVSADALQVSPDTDLAEVVRAHPSVDFVVCDEAQFYEPAQVEQLADLVDADGIDVYAFGLLTSFQGVLFAGTARFLELADERSELAVESRCWCGRRATHNARIVDGVQVFDGALMVVGDTPDSAEADQSTLDLRDVPDVHYELLCRAHWRAGRPASRATSPSPQLGASRR